MTRSIAIAGAGSIGCYVGGMLRASGHEVAFLGRPRIIAEIAAHGLTVTSLSGDQRRLKPAELAASDEPAVLATADIVLVTVKSADTAAMAEVIAAHARQDALIISLQNGVTNAPALRASLGARRVLAGMVPFNVIARGDGRYHRATSGDILLERDGAGTAAALSVPGLPVEPVDAIEGVLWGKLLVNLNNALNALSGLPLRDQLGARAWRRLLAGQMREALAALAADGIAPVSTTKLPPRLLPAILELPDLLFKLIARPMLRIDPSARSSMSDDLAARRRTEIDYLQGEIVRLATRHGLGAPLCERVTRLVREAETAGRGSPGLTPADIGG